MKKSLKIMALALLPLGVFAQVNKCDDVKKSLTTENKDTVAWVHGGMLNLGINQGFIHNWAAGGELAALAVNGLFSGFLIHYNHNVVWTNNLDVSYGLNYVYSNNFVPRKVDDRIDFTSKYGSGVKGEKSLFYTALFNFKSQFTKGFDYSLADWQKKPSSGLFAPAYLTLAAGMEYRKGTVLTLFLSPIAARATYADTQYTKISPQGAFGIPYGKTSVYQFGAYFTGRYSAELTKLITFNTRLDLYANYLAKDTKNSLGVVVKKDNPGNVQVFWDNLITWKATKSLGLTMGCTIAYSNDNPYSQTSIVNNVAVEKNLPGDALGWVQLKQSFTLGLVKKF